MQDGPPIYTGTFDPICWNYRRGQHFGSQKCQTLVNRAISYGSGTRNSDHVGWGFLSDVVLEVVGEVLYCVLGG
jgi:hypothetical protein